MVINDVAPGHHEVAVEKSGYTTTKQEFTLAAGQSLPLNLTLSPVSVEVPRPEGGVAAAPGGPSGPRTRQAHDPHTYRLLGRGGRDARFRQPGAQIRHGYPPGQQAARPLPRRRILSQTELKTVHDLTTEGHQDELLQWVFVGLTGAFAIAGGVLLYKGYLASEGSKQSASNHGLRIFPTASASAGGIIAEFDF